MELFGEVGKAAASQGAGALFILDEMQFLSRGDLGLLATVCHHLSQEIHPVLIAGAGLPQLPLMLKEAKPYTERLFNYKTIENLRRPEAARALTLPAKRAGVEYQDAALELILDRSAGYPFFLQQWGETVWAEAEGDSEITLDDAQAAEEVVDDELERRFFRDRYEKATDAEKIYMAALADLGDGRHTSAEIADHLGTTQRAVSVRRANLLQKGLIYNPVDTKLDFTVPHFAAYMRGVHPFDRAERPRQVAHRGATGSKLISNQLALAPQVPAVLPARAAAAQEAGPHGRRDGEFPPRSEGKAPMTPLTPPVCRGAPAAHRSTITSNPPQIIRLPSNGMFFESIMSASRGSFITLALTRSRCARDLNTIHENTTVSPGFRLTLRGNEVSFPIATSSATHSRYSSAP